MYTMRGFTRIIATRSRRIDRDVWIGVRAEGLRKRREDYGSEGKIGEKEAAVIQQCHRAHRVGEINEMHFHAYFDTG